MVALRGFVPREGYRQREAARSLPPLLLAQGRCAGVRTPVATGADLRRAGRAVVRALGARISPDARRQAETFWNEKHERDAANRLAERPAADPIDYTCHGLLYAHAVSAPLTGQVGRYWLEDVGERWLVPPPARMLAIGCGPAFIEEQILERNFAGRIVAFDLAPRAIEGARRRLAATPWKDRIELVAGDPLEADLQTGSFDAVFAEASLHHVVRIEEMFALIHRVLVPGGLLLFDEYVGPDLTQYPPHLLQILNQLNACLAPELRRDYLTGEVRERVEVCPLEWMERNDPTEGIHASQILPLTRQFFEILDQRPYGGGVLRPLMSRILLNFDFESNPRDQTIGRLLAFIDGELSRAGVIENHNVVVVARRQP